MIPKASQRGGGQHLATHLLNSFDNERVEIADLRGAIAPDLHGAFAEWRATSKATKCIKYLYSLSVNPDPQQGPLTREHYLEFIARTEKKLGLEDQPRAVVFHIKHGREHCHVVWSRINTEKLKAVQLSHDHQKLRLVVREFARDHDLKLPPGLEKDKGKDRFKDRQKVENLTEQQQEERSGLTKQERLALITQAWHATKTGQELIRALEERGYYLARGDSRAYVVVDRAGEIHSLARQITGANKKDVDARLVNYPVDKLPDAKTAQESIRKKIAEERIPAQVDPKAVVEERRAALLEMQQSRRADLDRKHAALKQQHAEEREALAEAHAAQAKGVASDRILARPKGIVAFLQRITGIQFLINHRQKKQDARMAQAQKAQGEALSRRHRRELQDFQHHYHALDSVEKRELRSLRTVSFRERFQAISRQRTTPAGTGQQTLNPAQLADIFRRAASQQKGIEDNRLKQRAAAEKLMRQKTADIADPPAKKKEPAALTKSFGETQPKEEETKNKDRERPPENLFQEFRDAAAPKSAPETTDEVLRKAREAQKKADQSRRDPGKDHER